MNSLIIQDFDYATLPIEEASVYQREAANIHQLLAFVDMALVKIGEALERAAAANRGNYKHWLKAEFGKSEDWSDDYRAIARNFPKASREQFHVGAAASLAQGNVTEDARQWALSYVAKSETKIDLAIAHIARIDSVRARYEDGELSKPQAHALVRALWSAMPEIRTLCIEQRAAWGEVVIYLNQAFIDRNRRSTWNDFQKDGIRFLWDDDTGNHFSVPIHQMTPGELQHGFIAYRRWLHYEAGKQEAAVKQAEQWATGDVKPLRICRYEDGFVALIVPESEIPETAEKLSISYKYKKV